MSPIKKEGATMKKFLVNGYARSNTGSIYQIKAIYPKPFSTNVMLVDLVKGKRTYTRKIQTDKYGNEFAEYGTGVGRDRVLNSMIVPCQRKTKYYNPNPLKKEVGDCVIRALCALEDRAWDDVYRELCDIGFDLKAMPNDKVVYEEYLKRHGYTRTPIGAIKRPTVNDMANRSKTEGAIYCEVANHCVTVKDGYILDLWDSGDNRLYGDWMK